MPASPFRFIHASDFHLERPLMGVADVPDHLRDLFLESPYTAARAGLRCRLGRRRAVRGALGRHRDSGRRPARAAVSGRTVRPAGPAGNRRLLGRLADRSAGGLAVGRQAAAKRPFLSSRPDREPGCAGRRRAVGAAGGNQLRCGTALAARRFRARRRGALYDRRRPRRGRRRGAASARHPLLGARRPARSKHAAAAARR